VHTQPAKPAPTTTTPKSSGIVMGALTVGAFVLALVALRPGVTVTPLDPVYSDKQTLVPFELRNDSYYSLSNVNIYCELNRADANQPNQGHVVLKDIMRPNWHLDTLDSRQSQTFPCNLSGNPTITLNSADVTILVRAKVFGIRLPMLCNRFEGGRGTSWRWFRRPCQDGDFKPKAIVPDGVQLK
jgi:hypothetical protein